MSYVEFDNEDSKDGALSANRAPGGLQAQMRKAFREWALRPGPMWTYVKMLFSDFHTFKRALRVGMEHFTWAVGAKKGD